VFYNCQGDTLVINVRVQPRASSDGFAEILNDRIKIRITAPPVDGKANKYLVVFLAKTFKTAKSNISIITGETGRNKQLQIKSPQQLPECIVDDVD
jgi:uncharacterized protein (TIGR00251 family)